MTKKIYWVTEEVKFLTHYAVLAETYAEANEIYNEGALKEVAQEHLGNRLTNVIEVDKDTYLKRFDKLNDYLSSIPEGRKMAFIHSFSSDDIDFTSEKQPSTTSAESPFWVLGANYVKEK